MYLHLYFHVRNYQIAIEVKYINVRSTGSTGNLWWTGFVFFRLSVKNTASRRVLPLLTPTRISGAGAVPSCLLRFHTCLFKTIQSFAAVTQRNDGSATVNVSCEWESPFANTVVWFLDACDIVINSDDVFYMDQSNISILRTDAAVASVNVRALNVWVCTVVYVCTCPLGAVLALFPLLLFTTSCSNILEKMSVLCKC